MKFHLQDDVSDESDNSGEGRIMLSRLRRRIILAPNVL